MQTNGWGGDRGLSPEVKRKLNPVLEKLSNSGYKAINPRALPGGDRVLLITTLNRRISLFFLNPLHARDRANPPNVCPMSRN